MLAPPHNHRLVAVPFVAYNYCRLQAMQPDMKMVVMPPPWPDLLEPISIFPLPLAQLLFNYRMDKDPCNTLICSGQLDHQGLLVAPVFLVNLILLDVDHWQGLDINQLFFA